MFIQIAPSKKSNYFLKKNKKRSLFYNVTNIFVLLKYSCILLSASLSSHCVVLVEVYEENPASHSCVIGKEKSVLIITFTDNWAFFHTTPTHDEW